MEYLQLLIGILKFSIVRTHWFITQNNLIPPIAYNAFNQGGHIERGSFTVKKSKKLIEKPDNSLKQLTETFIRNKELERKKYNEEVLKQQQLERQKQEEAERKQKELEEEKRQQEFLENQKAQRDLKIIWNFDQKIYHIMRDADPDNEQLHKLSEELNSDLGTYKQFRYSQGDPEAIQDPKLNYRLSNVNNVDLEEKLSSEQNRAVYDQVRPSYYGEKRDQPLFDSPVKRIVDSSGRDITIKSKLERQSTLNKQGNKM